MRSIGSVEDEHAARRFGDYLLTLSIHNEVERDADRWTVWVHEEGEVERAKQELEAFRAAPDDPKYQAVKRQANALRREHQRALEERQRNFIDARTTWAPAGRGKRTVTRVVIALSIVITLLGQLGSYDNSITRAMLLRDPGSPAATVLVGEQLETPQALEGPWSDVTGGQVWRLLTPIFVHFTPLHLLFNMYMLWMLGGQLEDQRPTGWWAGFVVLTGLASNVGQAVWQPFVPFGGMSGVLYAVFGYMWIRGRQDARVALPSSTVVILLGWFVLCAVGVMGNIANGSHGVGLIAGMVWGALPSKAE